MSGLGQTDTNNLSSKMTASPLKADILLRLGGVSSVPGPVISRVAKTVRPRDEGVQGRNAITGSLVVFLALNLGPKQTRT